jgi:protein-tyrosine phosphatase
MRVVLAHPERNRSFRHNPDRLRELVDSGVLVQVTAPGLIKQERRSRSRSFALSLIEDGLCHLLASDAHSAGPSRGPALAAAANAAAEVAPLRTGWMIDEVAPAVLAGEDPPPPPATDRPKRRLLAGLRA